jgi:hypothetical protein
MMSGSPTSTAGIERMLQVFERVSWWHDEQQLFAKDRHRGQTRLVDRQRQQRKIRACRSHAAQEPWRPSSGNPDLDVGMNTAEFFQQSWKEVEAHRHPADQMEGAAQILLPIDDRRAGFANVGKHPVAELQERLAGRRYLYLTAEPQEQRFVQFFLEEQDLPADRRLRDVQPCSGPGERARVRDRPDDFKLSEIHGRQALRIFALASSSSGSTGSSHSGERWCSPRTV